MNTTHKSTILGLLDALIICLASSSLAQKGDPSKTQQKPPVSATSKTHGTLTANSEGVTYSNLWHGTVVTVNLPPESRIQTGDDKVVKFKLKTGTVLELARQTKLQVSGDGLRDAFLAMQPKEVPHAKVASLRLNDGAPVYRVSYSTNKDGRDSHFVGEIFNKGDSTFIFSGSTGHTEIMQEIVTAIDSLKIRQLPAPIRPPSHHLK